MHYVSKLTSSKIIYLIRKHFPLFTDFTDYADIGVGIPYLVGAMKSYFAHINAVGIDLSTAIEIINTKLKATDKQSCTPLHSIVFSSVDIIADITKKESARVFQYLKKCQVITNFIGLVAANESVIKNVLPNSSCRVIMFRLNKVSMPKLHQEWLHKMKFVAMNKISGVLALQVYRLN